MPCLKKESQGMRMADLRELRMRQKEFKRTKFVVNNYHDEDTNSRTDFNIKS